MATAQDWALIITTVTTAITALAGVGVPLYNKRFDTQVERNRSIQSEIRDAIVLLLEETEKRDASNQIRVDQQSKAMQAKTVTDLSEIPAAPSDDFSIARKRLELLGAAYNVPLTRLGTLCSAQAFVFVPYWESIYKNDPEKSKERLRESLDKSHSLEVSIHEEFHTIWQKVNAKYPI